MHVTTELEEIARRVWEPGDAVREALAELDGDIVVLGAGGKMGVSLARMAACAQPEGRRVHAVSRFTDEDAQRELEEAGVLTHSCDLMDPAALSGLPDAPNVVYMVGRKFGTFDDPTLTWTTNTEMPAQLIRRYAGSRFAAFSTGAVYPFFPLTSGGATERDETNPIGEYAASCVGRERILSHHAVRTGTPLVLLRLNYAIDCRYGVLTDIARAVLAGEPIEVTTACVNVIWQGDANAYALRSLLHVDVPPLVLNMTGPETISVRWLAGELGRRLGVEPTFVGSESGTAAFSNAARCFALFGYPTVTLSQMLDWTAAWLQDGGQLLDKPTHYAERAGQY